MFAAHAMLVTTSAPGAPPSVFVTRDVASGNLMLAGQRFRFAGNNGAGIGLQETANAYGGTAATAPVAGRGSYALHLPTHSETDDYLAQCVAMNAKVIRSFAAMMIGHPLSVQPTLGTFSGANLESLDYGLQRCAALGIRMVLPLSDNFELYMGGKFDYCRMNSVTPDASATQFFTNLTIRNRFKAHINFVLNHVNVYTGVAYKDDPTILAWETGNELGLFETGGTWSSTYLNWTNDIATHIKTTGGAQQLVADGHCLGDNAVVVADQLALTNVDIYQNHPYANAPDNLVVNASRSADAKAAGKAFIWGEWPVLGYGFPTDIFGNYGAAGWTLPGAFSHLEGLEPDGDMFWALFPSLTGWITVFTVHSPGDNPDMITRVNQLTAHAARMPTLTTTELLSDTMTGTNGVLLHNHTAGSGSTWVKQASTDGTTAGSGTIQTNRVWFLNEASYVASGQPPSADYDVTATVRIVTAAQNAQVFVNGRAVSGEKTTYRALLLCFNGSYSVSLWRWINGTGTQLGGYAGIATPSNGTSHTLVLRMDGDHISALWDGDTVALAVDNNIRAAGRAGCGGINSTATTGLHIDSIAVAPVVDPVGMGFTPTANTVVAVGDSITDNWSNQSYQPYLGASYLPLLSVQTKQRMRYLGIYATGSMTAQQVRTTHLPQVLALSPRPGACIIHCGTNNTGSTVDALTGQAVVKEMMADLMAVGILPIMVTIGPHDEFPSATPYAMAWNDWAEGYAALHGLPLMDNWTALTDPDNTYKAGFAQSDGLHPSALGYAAMVNQAIADGLPTVMPVNDPTVFTARTTGDLTNLINDGTTNLGMFSVDTNADGVSNGFTTSGQAILRSIASGWSPGNKLAFGCRVQTQNITSLGVGWYLQVRLTVPGGFTYPDGGSATLVEVGAFNWLFDADGLLYVEFVVPSGTTAVEVRATLASGTITYSRVSPAGGDALAGSWQQLRNNANSATLRVGEMTLRVI